MSRIKLEYHQMANSYSVFCQALGHEGDRAFIGKIIKADGENVWFFRLEPSCEVCSDPTTLSASIMREIADNLDRIRGGVDK
jgi:hypothetical protein